MFSSDLMRELRAEFFENSEMLLSIYDKDLTLVDVNEAFLKALHFKRTDLIGKNVSEFSPDCKSSGRYAIYEEVIRTGVPQQFDQVTLHPSLGNTVIRLRAFKVGNGMGLSAKDITDLKEMIDELETFIYKTSHDIRAPIATMLGLSNIAVLEFSEQERALHYFELIRTQVRNLDSVVSRLLETTKIRQGALNIQLIIFQELLGDVMHQASAYEGFQNVTFIQDIDVPRPFHSDRHLLSVLIMNLIDNAIKYRNPSVKSKVLIKIRSTERGVNLTFDDNGLGIKEAMQKDVFKMFFRANDKIAGSGLGLYTVRHCVKKLHGFINLSSVENEGTVFSVFIPDAQDLK